MPSTTRPNDVPTDDLDDVLMPEMTDDEAARVRPIGEAPASLQAALAKNRGGRPRVAEPKVHVSLRLDARVLSAYKATGDGWQTRMHEAIAAGAPRKAS